MHIYEYLFTALIIFAMLLASATMTATISDPSRSVSEKEQLKLTTEKLMTQLLLYPGDPADWGSDPTISLPNNLGLAKYSETSREAYTLDADKVLRLDSNHPLFNGTFGNASQILDLLNLGNDYGLKLEIFPVIKVDLNQTANPDIFTVTATSTFDELPVSNANVTAKMYFADEDAIIGSATSTNQTGIYGNCTFSFIGTSSEMRVLVLVIDYYGISVVKMLPIGNWIPSYLIGKQFLTDARYSNPSGFASQILLSKNISSGAEGTYIIDDIVSNTSETGPSPSNANFSVYDLTSVNALEPSCVGVASVFESGSNEYLALASKEASITYSTIPGASSFPFSYSVERTVVISGSTFIIRLYLWRMSW